MLSPLRNLDWMDITFERFLDKEQEKGTQAWQDRNENQNIISGSVFSTCARKAWYQRTDYPKAESFENTFSLFFKKILFLGTKSEGFIFEAIQDAIDRKELKGVLHVDQTTFPVRITHDENGETFGSTTDGVLEIVEDMNGKPITLYIPIELKQHDRPSSAWWKRMVNKSPVRVYDGKEPHKRQLTHWMALAQMQGLEVPYGILKYNRRIDYDQLSWIFYYDKYYHLLADGVFNVSPEEYSLVPVESWIVDQHNKREDFVTHVRQNTTPTQGSGLSAYDCEGCPYKRPCWEQDGNPRNQGSSRLKE